MCCLNEQLHSVHKVIRLFVAAIPKHMRMSPYLEEQMDRGYESMYYKVPDNPALYNCKVCGKTVSNRWHHTRSHKPQNLKCPLCQQVFTRRDNMKTHLKWKHGGLSI
jgi:rubrerythrin